MVVVTAGTRERLTVDDSSSMKAGQKTRRDDPRRVFSRLWDNAFAFGIRLSRRRAGTKRRQKSDELLNQTDVRARVIDATR